MKLIFLLQFFSFVATTSKKQLTIDNERNITNNTLPQVHDCHYHYREHRRHKHRHYEKHYRYAVCKAISGTNLHKGVLISENELVIAGYPGVIHRACCKGPRKKVRCSNAISRREAYGYTYLVLNKTRHVYESLGNRSEFALDFCKVIGLNHPNYKGNVRKKKNTLALTCECLQSETQCEVGDAVVCDEYFVGMVGFFSGMYKVIIFQDQQLVEVESDLHLIVEPNERENETLGYWGIVRGGVVRCRIWKRSLYITLFVCLIWPTNYYQSIYY